MFQDIASDYQKKTHKKNLLINQKNTVETDFCCFNKFDWLFCSVIYIYISCTLRSWIHTFSGQYPRNGRTTMYWHVVATIFHKPWDTLGTLSTLSKTNSHYGKLSELYLNVPLSSNCREKVLNRIKIWSRVWQNFNAIFKLLSTRLKQLLTFQCIVFLKLRGDWPKHACNQDLTVQYNQSL